MSVENTFNFISIYWLIPVPIIFALLGLGLLHRWLGAVIFGGVSLIASLIMYDSYLTSYTDEWLGKQRAYKVIFRDFPKDKEVIVNDYAMAFETGGKTALTKKHEEMKVLMMANYSKHYIENASTDLITSYIKAQTWLLGTIYRKDYKLCDKYINNFMHYADVWNAVGDEIFLTSVLYNPYIISEAVYNPEQITPEDRTKAVQLYRKLIRQLRAEGAIFSNEAGKIKSCDTIYRHFYALSQMPPNDAALLIKLIYSENSLGITDPMTWLQNLIPF